MINFMWVPLSAWPLWPLNNYIVVIEYINHIYFIMKTLVMVYEEFKAMTIYLVGVPVR